MSNFRNRLKQFFWIMRNPKLVKSWIGWLPVGFEDLSNQEIQCVLLGLMYWRIGKNLGMRHIHDEVEKAYLPEISTESVDRISQALCARLNTCMANRARFGGDAQRFSAGASRAKWIEVWPDAEALVEAYERMAEIRQSWELIWSLEREPEPGDKEIDFDSLIASTFYNLLENGRHEKVSNALEKAS